MAGVTGRGVCCAEDPRDTGPGSDLNVFKLVFFKHYSAREGSLVLRSARLMHPSTSVQLVARSLAKSLELSEDRIEVRRSRNACWAVRMHARAGLKAQRHAAPLPSVFRCSAVS